MPLQKGKSKEAFRSNVKTEIAAGRPVKQAVAIAYHEAGESKHPVATHKHGAAPGHVETNGEKRK